VRNEARGGKKEKFSAHILDTGNSYHTSRSRIPDQHSRILLGSLLQIYISKWPTRQAHFECALLNILVDWHTMQENKAQDQVIPPGRQVCSSNAKSLFIVIEGGLKLRFIVEYHLELDLLSRQESRLFRSFLVQSPGVEVHSRFTSVIPQARDLEAVSEHGDLLREMMTLLPINIHCGGERFKFDSSQERLIHHSGLDLQSRILLKKALAMKTGYPS
jgi:hypothetical protein